VSGVLRFVGVVNAAIWLGSTVLWVFGARPAAYSSGMAALLGPGNYPYFSGAIAHVVAESYFRLQIACGLVALLQWAAERFYFGRSARKYALGLVVGLLAAGLAGGYWIEPRGAKAHLRENAPNLRQSDRALAARSSRFWQALSQLVNVVVLGGQVVYVWRVNTAIDTPRFVSSVKPRG
jgi:hypothetical protein